MKHLLKTLRELWQRLTTARKPAARTTAAEVLITPQQPCAKTEGKRQPQDDSRDREAGTEAKFRQRTQWYLLPIRHMAAYVERTYEFRHNIIRDTYEYRRKDETGETAFRLVDKQQLNTICIDIQDKGNVFCYDRYVEQRIRSNYAHDYHPVTHYINRIRGTWDGRDRTADLLRRINGDDYCLQMGRLWLRAVVAQWMGFDPEHANAVMLLLVSERQGMQKSTFLRSMLPRELQEYYTDDFSLASNGNAQRKLVEYAIVNIDEFDKEPARKMPQLKTLMQTMKPSFIGAYKKNFNQLPRIASFTGTSNTRQLLTDRTGSRRFLILEPAQVIPVDGIDHDQLYAQLVYEVEHGERYYFTKAEEEQMNRRNQAYYVPNELEQLVTRFCRAAREGEDAREISGQELMRLLTPRNTHLMRHISQTEFGRTLSRLNIPRIHTRDGNAYRVVLL